jgi:hypothetical protein
VAAIPHSDTTRFDRLVAGAAMVLAPLVIVLAEVLHAQVETEATALLSRVAADPGRWLGSHVLVLTALVLVVPAYVGVVRLVRPKRPRVGSLGLVLFVPGLVALTALVGMEVVLWQMAQPEAAREEMVALVERLNESAALMLLYAAALLFPLAWLLIGIGLYLARTAPVWAAVLVASAQPVGFVAELSGAPKWIAVAAQAAFAIGLIPIGLRVLRSSDRDAEEPLRTRPAPA